MGTVALSSFWIHDFPIPVLGLVPGRFSPIHLLSLWALWSLWVGVRHAVRGRTHAHRSVFRSLYRYGLLVAGSFNVLPGRRMNQVVFGDDPDLGLWVIGAVAVVTTGVHLRRRMMRPRDPSAV